VLVVDKVEELKLFVPALHEVLVRPLRRIQARWGEQLLNREGDRLREATEVSAEKDDSLTALPAGADKLVLVGAP